MAVAGKTRVCDLLPELLADTFIVLGPFQSAGAVSSGAF